MHRLRICDERAQVWEKAGIGLAVVHGNLPAENLNKKAGVGDRTKFNSIDRYLNPRGSPPDASSTQPQKDGLECTSLC